MKELCLKAAVVVAVLTMSMNGKANAQGFGGKVMNEKGEPLAYVSVVMMSLPDSTFVQGAVTDEEGRFNLATKQTAGLLKLTSIGYETQYLTVKTADELNIRMKENAQMLGEVVVKSQLPKTFVKGDAMRTTVGGTILEKAGTASDMLNLVPMLKAERDGAVEVLGRGEAEVYVNGRRVMDIKELSRLRADQIQYVEVVQNPGARYAAAVKAVVRITLKKAKGEGLSFQENATGMYQYGHTLTNNLDVNYRTGGLDVTASFWAGRYGHSKSLQDNDLFYYVGPDVYKGDTYQDTKHIWKGWSPQLQVNYMMDDNHSLGAFYKYDRHPSGELTSVFNTDNYINSTLTEHSLSDIWQDDRFSKHIFNAYYNGKVGLLGIDLNVDGLFDDTEDNGRTTERMTPADHPEASTERNIESNTNSGNNFWASKLVLTYPVWKGNLSAGGEYSYNHRTDAYDYIASDAVPVRATDTEINESAAAGFVEYGRQFGKVFVQAGVRYEHLTNDYYNFGKKEEEVCRNYGDWFPTAVVALPLGKLQLSLSYRRDIQRPNYANLTSSTIYINRYTYQSGNPYLTPTYTHSLVLNSAYQWLNVALNYQRVKDIMTMATDPFPGAADPMISLVRPINSKDDYNQFSIAASARPTIGCWHPMWQVYTIFQNYKTPTADGSIKTLNHPFVTLSWQNNIELPRSWRLSGGMQWTSRGDYNNNRITATRFMTMLGVQHDINLKRLGTLTADLRCGDLFNTNKTAAIIYGYRELNTSNPARRTFMLDLTWKFNEAQSKYRGKGAGEQQKARM
ncbi:MAG: TonB-dependent receptor [Bacteroidales bacterium]|nr:TonB-dependent receptor [Bacteroidales bacterium]